MELGACSQNQRHYLGLCSQLMGPGEFGTQGLTGPGTAGLTDPRKDRGLFPALFPWVCAELGAAVLLPALRLLCPQGLKTGMYYLRTKPAANPIQFTLNKEKLREREKASREEEEKERNKAAMVCSLENREECLMCGS